ncbi:MAG TPA: TIGR00730 family Rossman fold protein [Candidatus Nitrosopolaris sp.]|nr:TIGR00730 family Rossman fold protein [Candidatus Nitrosopolaris sp.]
MRRICVFAGSSLGAHPEYVAAARELGRTLARDGIGLVYGGGSIGLMGVLADSVLDASGEVIGVIPQRLATREIAHQQLADLRVVGSMHERKALMAELADGFIALPGGLGTLEELLEVTTWAQLGLHAKPIGLLDVRGYFAPLVTLIERAVAEGFVAAENRGLLIVASDVPRLLAQLRTYVSPRGFRPLIRLEET